MRWLALAVLTLVIPASAAADQPAPLPHLASRRPASLVTPPPGYLVSGNEAIAIARRQRAVIHAEHGGRPLRPQASLLASDWVIGFYSRHDLRAQVRVNGRSGRVQYARSGRELTWPPLAGAWHGAYARAVRLLLVLAALLFVLPFVDRRRPLRLLHLDLVVILTIAISFGFAQAGRIDASTPLRYPPFIYLACRLGWIALRRAGANPGRLTWAPVRLLAVALAGLLAARYGLDIAYGHVNDIGYDSLFGADSLIHGYSLYDPSSHLGSYGPALYIAYVPFAHLFPIGLTRADTGGAIAAAIFWDLGTVATLYAIGRRLRAGPAGTELGLALAFAFAACPWSSFVLSQNTNDGLVALLLALVLLAATSPLVRGLVLGFAAAAKFAPLVAGALFMRVGRERGRSAPIVYLTAVGGVSVLLIAAFLPDSGLRGFWDLTLGYELHRSAPFSLWGLHPSLKPLQWLIAAFGAGIALASLHWPRDRTLPRLAAAGGALIVIAQLTSTYWYFFYVVWFLPFALVALLADSSPARTASITRST